MTINSVTFVKTKIAIMMIRNLQMQRSTKISTFSTTWSNKEILCLLYPDTKNRSRCRCIGDKADDDKKSDETTVDDKPKEDTKSSAEDKPKEDIKPVLTENIRRTEVGRGK
jgi:hypothetical protein